MKKEKYLECLVRLTGVLLGTKADADVAVATAARSLTLIGKEMAAAKERGEIRAEEAEPVSRGPVRKLSNEELIELVGPAKEIKQVIKDIRMKTGCTRETAYRIIKRAKTEKVLFQDRPTDAIRSVPLTESPAPADAGSSVG